MADESSVLVIPIPEADVVFGDIRRLHDPSGRDGMPAHVTVLTPFVPVALWDERHARRLRAALASDRPFEARFRRPGRFGETTVFLVPEPEDVFRDLSRRVAAAFPEYPPYGGAFSEVLPHLTLAHGVDPSILQGVEARVRAGTEIRSRVEAVVVYSQADEGRWVQGPQIRLRQR